MMKTKSNSLSSGWLITMLSAFTFLAAFQAAAQSENGVTLYERIDQDNAGAHRSFPAGTYQQTAADVKFMLITSSIKVPDGYEVRLCDRPPNSSGGGARICDSYFEGNYNLSNRLSRRFTYLNVQFNRYVRTRNVCLFAGFDQMGLPVCFGLEGAQTLSFFKFEHPANFDLPNVGDWRNKASSIWVKAGYSADVCTNARVIILPNQKQIGSNCATYAAGEHNFPAAVNNQSVRITVKRTTTTKLPPDKKTPKIFLPNRKP